MFLFDNRITLENRDILEEYLNGFEYKTSGLSYSALYMWRDINQFSWDMIGDYMCMSGVSHLELEQGIELPFLFPPLTKQALTTRSRSDRRSLRRGTSSRAKAIRSVCAWCRSTFWRSSRKRSLK